MSAIQAESLAASDTAREIARAAARLFAAKGYDATSVRDIVEAARITKPTLYYYFHSKQGLAEALLTVPMTRLLESMRRVEEESSEPVEQVARLLEVQFEYCRAEPDWVRFVYALFFGPAGSALSLELASYGQALTEINRRAVERLAKAGVIAEPDIERCTAALRGLVTVYTMDYLYRGLELDAGMAERLVNDLIRGFAKSGHDKLPTPSPERS